MRWLIPILLLVSYPAHAQSICGERAGLVKYLAEDYGETRLGMGLSGLRIVVELFTSPKGTWTVLINQPGKPTCVMGFGEGWIQDKPKDKP